MGYESSVQTTYLYVFELFSVFIYRFFTGLSLPFSQIFPRSQPMRESNTFVNIFFVPQIFQLLNGQVVHDSVLISYL
jgi:hypothetical protein